MLPEVSAKAMNQFLAQFAATLAEDEHAVLVLDRSYGRIWVMAG